MTTQERFAGEMSHDLSVCHSRAPSRCEHLIMLRAMRLLHSPTVRRLRSLIELLALDDKPHAHDTAVCEPTDWAAAMPVANQQPRIGHDPIDFIFGGQCLNTRATPSGTEEKSRVPFPTQPPSKGMRPTAPYFPVAVLRVEPRLRSQAYSPTVSRMCFIA